MQPSSGQSDVGLLGKLSNASRKARSSSTSCGNTSTHPRNHPLHSHFDIPSAREPSQALRHAPLKMLARSSLRATRAFGSAKNGATRTAQVRRHPPGGRDTSHVPPDDADRMSEAAE